MTLATATVRQAASPMKDGQVCLVTSSKDGEPWRTLRQG